MASIAAAPSTRLQSSAPVSLEVASEAKAGKRIRRLAWPATAAAAALLLVGIGVLGVLLNRAIDDRDQARTTAEMLASYVSSGGQVVTLQATEPTLYKYYKGQGSLLLAPGKEPVLVVAGCPESGGDLTYWVWLAKEGERVPAGELTVGEDGSGWLALDADEPIDDFDMVGVTLELSGAGREDVLTAPLAEGADQV